MKQVTIVLHFDDDKQADRVYNILNDSQHEVKHDPTLERSLLLVAKDIIHVCIAGPNDNKNCH